MSAQSTSSLPPGQGNAGVGGSGGNGNGSTGVIQQQPSLQQHQFNYIAHQQALAAAAAAQMAGGGGPPPPGQLQKTSSNNSNSTPATPQPQPTPSPATTATVGSYSGGGGAGQMQQGGHPQGPGGPFMPTSPGQMPYPQYGVQTSTGQVVFLGANQMPQPQVRLARIIFLHNSFGYSVCRNSSFAPLLDITLTANEASGHGR